MPQMRRCSAPAQRSARYVALLLMLHLASLPDGTASEARRLQQRPKLVLSDVFVT